MGLLFAWLTWGIINHVRETISEENVNQLIGHILYGMLLLACTILICLQTLFVLYLRSYS